MVWCAEQRRSVLRVALAVFAASVVQATATAEDPDVARWFNRHDDAACGVRWPNVGQRPRRP